MQIESVLKPSQELSWIACFFGKRGSNDRPARWCQSGKLPHTAPLASSHALPAKLPCRFRLSTTLPLCGLIEELQSLLYRALLPIEINFFRGNHADRFPNGDPLQLVSRPDSVLVGDGFGCCVQPIIQAKGPTGAEGT